MAVAPVNKFLTVAVPVAPGPQKLYEVPTGVSSILLFAQVSNVGIGASYPAVTFWHRRTSRSTGNFRDTRVIRDIQVPPNDAVVLIDGRLVLEKDAIKVDEIYVDAKQTGIVSVTGAVYDEPSGIVTVTTLTPHNFGVGQEITLSGLEFKCPSGTGITTTMEEIANTIGGEVKFIPRRNFEVEAHQADMSNCYKLLDWRPKIKVLEWLSNFVKNI